MLIVKLENGVSIEKALKQYKGKVIKTKQSQQLSERREFKKKSVRRREMVKKAEYLNRKGIETDMD
jgi:small subunit ribosomal protein S21